MINQILKFFGDNRGIETTPTQKSTENEQKTGFRIKAIEFNDGTELSIENDDIIVVVGANNSGKSATLRGIYQTIHKGNGKSYFVKSLHATDDFKKSDIESHVMKYSKIVHESSYSTYRGIGFSFLQIEIDRYWKYNEDRGLGDLTGLFVQHVGTEERLSITNPPKNISLTSSAPEHPIHIIQKLDHLEVAFSNYFRQAFNTDLVLNRNAGSDVPFHVGQRPIAEEGEDRVKYSYVLKIEKLPLLHHQGDGMRSFVGILLHAFVTHHNLTLIDEPEAFLHPPQARMLGKMLSTHLPKNKQLIIATHSEDFLKGILDSSSANVRIIRIQRNGNANPVRTLEKEAFTKIWSDSLLRHSNILGGLFHPHVIVCESDSDCRFYSAMITAMCESKSIFNPDILFVHCGGKHRIPVVIKALNQLGVPITVIADFDILNGENPLKEIFELQGGDWSHIVSEFKIVNQAIAKRKPELETQECKKEIATIFERIKTNHIPIEFIDELQRSLKRTSPWSLAKDMGKSFISRGDEYQKFAILDAKLKETGIFIVEVGELEGFAKSIPGHGPKWVNNVLEKDLVNDPELSAARTFAEIIIARTQIEPVSTQLDHAE